MADTTNVATTKNFESIATGAVGITMTARNNAIEYIIGGASITAGLVGHILKRDETRTWRLAASEQMHIRSPLGAVAVISQET